jgi:hypothetical protein
MVLRLVGLGEGLQFLTVKKKVCYEMSHSALEFTDCCELDNGPSCSIKGREFLHQLSDH